MAVILSLSISAARGEELLFNASSTAQFSTGMTGIMHPLQINSGKSFSVHMTWRFCPAWA
jgi:hypothetical protein